MSDTGSKVYRFKITLKDIKPRIWRRIQVPGSATFWDLSVAIQDAMQWGGHHLHEFIITDPWIGAEVEIGLPDDEFLKKGCGRAGPPRSPATSR